MIRLHAFPARKNLTRTRDAASIFTRTALFLCLPTTYTTSDQQAAILLFPPVKPLHQCHTRLANCHRTADALASCPHPDLRTVLNPSNTLCINLNSNVLSRKSFFLISRTIFIFMVSVNN